MESIELITPTQRAFGRMRSILFEPFDIGKWFLLGFSAWLAALADGGSGGGNSYNTGDAETWDGDVSGWGTWFEENMLLGAAIIIGVLLVIFAVLAIVVALLWVSSRGKFMFLDNLVHDRTLIKQPWKEFKREADSLFLWRLGLAIIGIGVVVTFAVAIGGAMLSGQQLLYVIIIAAVLMLIVILVLAYLVIQLEHFIVPIMYKERITTRQAIDRFLPLHQENLIDFLLYFLWLLLLWTGVVVAIFVLGFATCCVGFLLMIIPYLGTVFLLPVQVFFRYLGPEFLRQYGGEWDTLMPQEKLPPDL